MHNALIRERKIGTTSGEKIETNWLSNWHGNVAKCTVSLAR